MMDYIAKSDMLKVIGHPVRLMILDELSRGTKCVTDVEHVLTGIRQANVSQHLALLRHCGIVEFQQEGNRRCYSLTNPEMISALLTVLTEEPSAQPSMAIEEAGESTP